MKTQFFKLLAITLLISSTSCKKEATIDYKYADSPKVLACDFEKTQLYNEAVYSFENDIAAFYDKQNKAVTRAYGQFTSNALNGRLKVEDIASEHSLDIAKALKTDASLWSVNGTNTTLNYSHPIVDCIVNNIKDNGLKTTFNALLSTNSMRPNLILTPLKNSSARLQSDGSLKTFVALEFYYSKLLNVDVSQLKKPEPEPVKTNEKVDFNKTPRPEMKRDDAPAIQVNKDDHTGHDH